MSNNRKKERIAGKLTVTQGPGGTTRSSGSSTINNGRGTRRTTTVKSNGQRYIRTTEGSGNGWFKTTQKSLNYKKPKALKHNSSDPFKITQRDINKLTSGGDGSTIIIFIIILAIMWIAEKL